MADDNPTLTRRRVLGSVATIGVAGALGATTWAEMSDTENATVSAEAGTLDLEVGGTNALVQVDFGDNLTNGDAPSRTIDLTNVGSLPGEALCFSTSNFSSTEGTNPDAETNTDTSDGGELDDVADLIITLSGDGETTYSIHDGAASGVESLNTCENLDTALEDQTYTLDITLDVPDEPVNEAMGDKFSFDLAATLHDTDQSGGGGGTN